jgi:tetratricopeptide (TPR) repeat protein
MKIRFWLTVLLFFSVAGYSQDFEKKFPKEVARVKAYMEASRCEEALSLLQPYLSRYNQDEFVLSAVARSYQCIRKFPEARYYFDRLIKYSSEDHYAYIDRAKLLILMGLTTEAHQDLATAQECLDKWSKINKKDDVIASFMIQSGYAWSWERIRQFAKAAEYYDVMISLEPNNVGVITKYGYMLGMSDWLRLPEALDALDQAAKIDPASSQPALYRFQLLDHYELEEAAETALELAYSLDKSNSYLLVELSGRMMNEKRYKDAVKLYEKAIELDTRYTEARRLHARALGFAGWHTQAMAAYDRLLLENPGKLIIVVGRSVALIQMGDTAAALRDFDRMMETKKESSEVACERGWLLRQVERNEEALLEYDRALNLDENNIQARINRANCNYHLKRYAPALEDMEFLLRKEPWNTSHLGFRGTLRHALGMHDLALADFAKILEYRPERHITIFERSKTYEFLEQYDKALADCEAALRLDPENAEYKAAIERIKGKQAGK